MTFIPRVSHEAEEQVFVLEVVITAHMHNEQVSAQLLAKLHSLDPVTCVVPTDQPISEFSCDEALAIGGEVV